MLAGPGSVRFCSNLLPVSKSKSLSRNEFYVMHSGFDPMVRLEKARNEWIRMRSKVEKLNREVTETEDTSIKEEKRTQLNNAGQELWCAMYVVLRESHFIAQNTKLAPENTQVQTKASSCRVGT